MKTISLKELEKGKSLEGRLREFAESIPNGEAVIISDLSKEWGLTQNPQYVANKVPELAIEKYHQGRKRWFLLNPSTAKEVLKNG